VLWKETAFLQWHKQNHLIQQQQLLEPTDTVIRRNVKQIHNQRDWSQLNCLVTTWSLNPDKTSQFPLPSQAMLLPSNWCLHLPHIKLFQRPSFTSIQNKSPLTSDSIKLKYFIISRASSTPDLMNITYNNGERTNLYSFQATGHSVQVNNIFPLTGLSHKMAEKHRQLLPKPGDWRLF